MKFKAALLTAASSQLPVALYVITKFMAFSQNNYQFNKYLMYASLVFLNPTSVFV